MGRGFSIGAGWGWDGLSPLMAAMWGLTWVWLFALGACLGSFLNVVVYRMPRGRQVLAGRSHCPGCGAEIRLRDNLPVLGWLLLRGKCRVCAWPIPARYPLVEAGVGLALVLLAAVELNTGGANLPHRVPNFRPGVHWAIWEGQRDLLSLFGHHFLLLYLLIGFALIAADGFPPPTRLAMFGVGVGIVWSWLDPGVHPIPAALPAGLVGDSVRGGGSGSVPLPLTALMGLAAGAGTGILASVAVLGAPRSMTLPGALVAGFALAGVHLGPSAIPLLTLLFGGLALSISPITRLWKGLARFNASWILAVAAFLFLTGWRFLDETAARLDARAPALPRSGLALGLGLVGLAIAARLWTRAPIELPDPFPEAPDREPVGPDEPPSLAERWGLERPDANAPDPDGETS